MTQAKPMNFLSRIIIHPLLFAIYPILFLFAKNNGQFQLHLIIVPVVVSLCLASLLWYLLGRYLLDKKKAAVVVSLFVILFFFYVLRLRLQQLAGIDQLLDWAATHGTLS